MKPHIVRVANIILLQIASMYGCSIPLFLSTHQKHNYQRRHFDSPNSLVLDRPQLACYALSLFLLSMTEPLYKCMCTLKWLP